jgi:hypothetical protein
MGKSGSPFAPGKLTGAIPSKGIWERWAGAGNFLYLYSEWPVIVTIMVTAEILQNVQNI